MFFPQALARLLQGTSQVQDREVCPCHDPKNQSAVFRPLIQSLAWVSTSLKVSWLHPTSSTGTLSHPKYLSGLELASHSSEELE